MTNKNYFIYVLLTDKNTYYCGYTDDVEKRFLKHKQGLGAKYTKAFKPIKILFQKKYDTKSEALKAEKKFKKLTKDKKNLVVNGYLDIDEL